MENNIIEESTVVTAEEQIAEPVEAIEEVEASSDNSELIAALIEARVKLALLLGGTAKDKLDDAAKIALGLVGAGMEPEEAAAKAIEEYPHFKLATREVPVFAAQTKGSNDGYAAIKSIFAKR